MKPNGPHATPYPIGSGPPGETCGTCALSVWRKQRYLKCSVADGAVMHSRRSDVTHKTPACAGWAIHRDLFLVRAVYRDPWSQPMAAVFRRKEREAPEPCPFDAEDEETALVWYDWHIEHGWEPLFFPGAGNIYLARLREQTRDNTLCGSGAAQPPPDEAG